MKDTLDTMKMEKPAFSTTSPKGGRHRKALILLGVLAAIAIGIGIATAVLPGQEPPARSKTAGDTLQALIDNGTLVDTQPDDLWEDESDVDGRGFTPRARLGADVDSIGVLTIEKIGVSIQVYDSENTMEDMKKGASHYRSTSYWDGNIGMAAHIGNASYSYFERLRELRRGDVLEYETTLGTRQYKVESISTIADDDWSMLERTEANCLTLTTCIAGSETQRLCVRAVEVA